MRTECTTKQEWGGKPEDFAYVKVSRDLGYLNFFLKNIIVGPYESETPPPLAQMVMTQSTSISELLVRHMAPPGGQI